MTIITAPKVHQFIPLAVPKVEQVKMALQGVPESLPEYRKTQLAAGAESFLFPEGFVPFRVDDILLEDTLGSRRILPNREAPRRGPNKTTIFDHENYDLDVATRKLTFHKPLETGMTMHWYCMDRSARFGRDWIEVSLKQYLIQGSNYIDQDLIPPGPNPGNLFQGSCRCFVEIVSLPAQGLIRKSNNTLGLSYRPRMGFIGLDSAEYLIYNSWGQVSDTYCMTFQMS